jgi:hypothetical protein
MAKDKKRHEDLNQVVKDLAFSPCRWTRKRSSGF